MKTKTLAILVSSILFSSRLVGSQHAQQTMQLHQLNNPTADCVKNSNSVERVVDCFYNYTVRWDYYTQETYDAAQPTPLERAAWLDTIRNLLDVDNGNCLSVRLPDALRDIYTISQTEEGSAGTSYCVFSEVKDDGTQYNKGWGLFITPARHVPYHTRHVHLSAPHPWDDLYTSQQAVALFKLTSAKSLLIAGRSRLAFKEPSKCVASAKTTYYVTDPAHNKACHSEALLLGLLIFISKHEPFYDATRTIHEWQNRRHGCSDDRCAFIQFHGKGASTCRTDQIFMSAGLGMLI